MTTHQQEDRMIQDYAVTFGDTFRHRAHPVLGEIPNLTGRYGTIVADSYNTARLLAHAALGTAWSMVYPPGELDESYFPDGHLFTITPNQDGLPVITYTPKGPPA